MPDQEILRVEAPGGRRSIPERRPSRCGGGRGTGPRRAARDLGTRSAKEKVNVGQKMNGFRTRCHTHPVVGRGAGRGRPGLLYVSQTTGRTRARTGGRSPRGDPQVQRCLHHVQLGTYNTTPELVAAAITPRTKAIIAAHALGNPFQAAKIAELTAQHGLFLIEDNCDAVGSTYRGQLTGTFGDMATTSFYPARHITTGEGGCVLTSNLVLARIVEQLRDWGRDCWCEPGEDNTCFKRLDYQLGTLPHGYDYKYIFSHVGYNLKSTDLQTSWD
jgi:hypothetical protein